MKSLKVEKEEIPENVPFHCHVVLVRIKNQLKQFVLTDYSVDYRKGVDVWPKRKFEKMLATLLISTRFLQSKFKETTFFRNCKRSMLPKKASNVVYKIDRKNFEGAYIA